MKGMRSHVTMLLTLSTSIGRLSLRIKVPLAMLLTAAGPMALHAFFKGKVMAAAGVMKLHLQADDYQN